VIMTVVAVGGITLFILQRRRRSRGGKNGP
jgi:hypothetical protein